MQKHTDTVSRKDLAGQINLQRKAVGQRWFQLALSWSHSAPKTKADRQAAIRHLHPSHAAGAKAKDIGGLAASLEKVESLAVKIRQARVYRRRLTLPSGRLHTVLVPMAERLQRRIASLAEEALLQGTSSPARDEVIVCTTTDPSKIGLVVQDYDCRPYGGSYKTWTAKGYIRNLTVPHRWISRVYKRGLAVIGGMMTLDAAPVDSPERGIDIYAAAWIHQGRGFAASVVHGYIAVSREFPWISYHGNSVNAAVAGLRRKMGGPAGAHARSFAQLEERLARAQEAYAGRKFVLADARSLGFCDYGIRSWCHRGGIDPDGQATIEQIVTGYRIHPVAEARQFILHYCR